MLAGCAATCSRPRGDVRRLRGQLPAWLTGGPGPRGYASGLSRRLVKPSDMSKGVFLRYRPRPSRLTERRRGRDRDYRRERPSWPPHRMGNHTVRVGFSVGWTFATRSCWGPIRRRTGTGPATDTAPSDMGHGHEGSCVIDKITPTYDNPHGSPALGRASQTLRETPGVSTVLDRIGGKQHSGRERREEDERAGATAGRCRTRGTGATARGAGARGVGRQGGDYHRRGRHRCFGGPLRWAPSSTPSGAVEPALTPYPAAPAG